MTDYTRREKCVECGLFNSQCKLVRSYELDGKIGPVCYPCRQKAWSKQKKQIATGETVDVGYY